MLRSRHPPTVTAEGGQALNLRIPGPIPVPKDILEEMSRPMINHRGPEYKEMLLRVTERLKDVFGTAGDVFVLTASGTGAMEAAVVNTLSPGDKVLCASVGSFGDRFGEIAAIFGADVTMLTSPQGSSVNVDELRKALKANSSYKAVLVTHNETSTGVTIDLEVLFVLRQIEVEARHGGLCVGLPRTVTEANEREPRRQHPPLL